MLSNVYRSRSKKQLFHISGEYEIVNVKKKSIILYQGYTYSKRNRSFHLRYCSKKKSLKCPARLILNADGTIDNHFDEHNHKPPKIHKTVDGTCYLY